MVIKAYYWISDEGVVGSHAVESRRAWEFVLAVKILIISFLGNTFLLLKNLYEFSFTINGLLIDKV